MLRAGGLLAFLSTAALAAEVQLPSGSVDAYRVESQYGASQAVLNPSFPKEGKLEIGLGVAFSPMSSLMKYTAASGSVTYHLSDRHAIEPIWFGRAWGRMGNFVKNETGPSDILHGDPSKLGVDVPEQIFAASYFFTPYYSKMHITEQSVAHFDFYFGAGFAVLRERQYFLDGTKGAVENRPGASLAMGLRFLFPSRWGLRVELRDFVHQAKNYGSSGVSNTLQVASSLDVFFGSFKGGARD